MKRKKHHHDDDSSTGTRASGVTGGGGGVSELTKRLKFNAISLFYVSVCLSAVFHNCLIVIVGLDLITTAAEAQEISPTTLTNNQQKEVASSPPPLPTSSDPRKTTKWQDVKTTAGESAEYVHRTVHRSVEDYENVDYPNQSSEVIEPSRLPPLQRLRSAEHHLHSMLFAPGRYQKNVRPLTDHEQSIKVRLGVCVMTIDEIIEKDQTMITSGCVKMKWNDEFLQWDPREFKNLSWVALPSTDIWIPDIALINSPDPYYITRKPAFSEVAFTGDVGYYPSGRFSTRCQISLTYFPFDWQKCDLRFESWVYPIQWLYLEPWHPDPIDMKDFYRNHQWDLDRFSVTPGNVTYDGLAFSTIRFSFYFRRRTLYYLVLSIFPCLIMSVLQMFSHTLPVEHPARMTLLTSLFVSSSVIQSSLASQMPKSSDGVSLIQLYLMIFSTNLLISMLITFINMHVWFRVPISVIPSMSRMLRAYFLDTGRPQQTPQQHAAATSAIAAISAAAMPLMPPAPQGQGTTSAPSVSYQQRKGSSSLLRKIGRKMNLMTSLRHHNRSSVAKRAPPRNTDDDEAAIAMVERKKQQEPQVGAASSSNVGVQVVGDTDSLEGLSTFNASTSGWDKPIMPPRDSSTLAVPNISPSYSSDSSIEAEYRLERQEIRARKASQGRSSGGASGAGCDSGRQAATTGGGCCGCLRRRGSRGMSGSLRHRHAVAKEAAVETTPPPPPPPASSARRGVVIALNQQPGHSSGQQQPASNLAERKDRWLQFSMLIDKVFLYAMFVYNILCPIVIFGLVPQIQLFYMDDDAESIYFDPANYYTN